MSRLGINTGTNPDDGQGDPLRVAMGKINSNFVEIYDSFGDGFSLISYASTAGISTLSRNLTGNPSISVSGILNTGITTTEHIEVRNITSTGIITAVQFIGDGSQLENVVATSSGVEVLDDNVRKGVAKELNFGANIISSGPDVVGRVTISVPSTQFSTFSESADYALVSGISTSSNYAEVSGISTNSFFAITSGSLIGSPDITVGVVTASLFVGDGSGLTNVSGTGGESYWILTNSGIHTFSNVGVGTTNPTVKLEVVGDAKFTGVITATSFDSVTDGASIIETSDVLSINAPRVSISTDLTTGGNIGIGTSIALSRLTVEGDGKFVGVVTATRFDSVNNGTSVIETSETLNINTPKVAISTDLIVGGNVGVGSTIPTSKMQITGGDIRVGLDTSHGLILTSPDGTKYRLIVDNSGILSTVLVP